MTVFQNYTGNALLNNALMTIESLAGLKEVKDISPTILKEQIQKLKPWELFKRMKSYTMLFTRNNLLTGNDKEGWKLYKALLHKIVENVESEGEYQCEISGKRFNTTFSELYMQAQKELNRKETGQDINRCFFPLIGSLGSDAQALPQAKYDIKIHPICLLIIQFLPFSALLYKGGVLLFDATNFEFTRDFIDKSVKRIQLAIKETPLKDKIENVKDFDQGKYLLRAIMLFGEKRTFYGDRYTDINLWSFTNSGTGASCEIDRIPNQVFKDLYQLYKKSDCQPDLKMILAGGYANRFITSLTSKQDYSGLYPRKNHKGVSIAFFEAYQELIEQAKYLDYAKYIAMLIKQASLTKAQIKMLDKTDAFNQSEYAGFFHKLLIDATEKDKWSLVHQIEILDDSNTLPIKNNTYRIFKKVHFYFQQKDWESKVTISSNNSLETTVAGKTCSIIIQLIEKDSKENFKNHQKILVDSQKYNSFSLAPVLVRQSKELTLSQISEFIFHNYRLSHYGLNALLRIYFLKPENTIPDVILPNTGPSSYLKRIENFANTYTKYYNSKYKKDWQKFQKHVLVAFPRYPSEFSSWLNMTFDRMRLYLKENGSNSIEVDKFEDTLCYDEDGNFNLSFTRFALQFYLNQQYYSNPILN